VEAQTGPTIITSPLNADQRRVAEGIRFLAGSRLVFFAKYVLGYDWLSERIHGPQGDFLTSSLFRKYRKSVQFVRQPDDSPKWEYGCNRPRLPKAPPDWNGTEVSEEFPRITQDFGRKCKFLAAPRKTGKTSLGTHGLSLFVPAVCNPNFALMIVFGSQDLSDSMGKLINDTIYNNKLFRYFYGGWEIGSPSMQERTKFFSCRKKSKRDASLLMTSVGAKITGLHPDGIILDDPIDESNCRSEAALQDIEDFHNSLFALDPEAMWVFGTRWGPTDLYGQRIIGQLGDVYDIYLRGARNPDGSLWYPEWQNEEFLAGKLKAMGKFLFQSQYLNVGVSHIENPMKSEHIKSFDPDNDAEIPKRQSVTRFLWCDPGGARGTGPWGMAIFEFARDTETDEPHLWVRAALKSKITSHKAAEEFCNMWFTWRPDAMGIENTSFSQSFIDDALKPMLRKRNILMRLTETKPGGVAKPTRVAGVQNSFGTLLEQGRVHIPRDTDGTRHGIRALRSEIAMFPSGTFDVLDAIAAGVAYVFENEWFPGARAVPAAKMSDYDRLMEDAERCLRNGDRRRLAGYGLSDDLLIGEALRDMGFRDVSRKEEEVRVS
jgi:hypothetical protein